MEWRKEVIEFALDHETRLHMDEQLAWIAREPQNPQPYYNLAQLYRMQWKQEEALGLLLESVRLDERSPPPTRLWRKSMPSAKTMRRRGGMPARRSATVMAPRWKC